MIIEMPNSIERERNINKILDMALPEKRTLFRELKRLFNTVGIRHAFCGVKDAAAVAIMISFGAILAFSIILSYIYEYNREPNFLFTPLLFFSPIFYFSLLLFTQWKERMTKTSEVLSSCRYNLKYITAVRTILVSAAGIVFIPITTLPLITTKMYPYILAAVFCSIFLYSILTLLMLLISESVASHLAPPIIWTSLWGLLIISFTPLKIERFFSSVPLIFSISLAFALLLLYIIQLRVFILKTTRRAVCN